LLKSKGKWCDGNNLWFVVSQNQTAKWVLRYTRAGRRHEMGLGSYPQVSLKEARSQAMLHLSEVRHGKDPIAERTTKSNRSNAPTFADCANQYIGNQQQGWRNKKHIQQWQNTIDQYCAPILEKPVDKVTQEDVLAILLPIWSEINETASRLRGRIEKVLGYAIAAKYRSEMNPALYKGSLEYLLPKVKRVVKHQPSLPWQEMPRLWSHLNDQNGLAKDALMLLILTASRSGEIREMTWQEVDLKNATWTIPSHRMKLGVTHTVPLSQPAIEILQRQKRGSNKDYIFSIRSNRPLSDMTLSALIKRINKLKSQQSMPGFYDSDGRGVTPHGFRSSFRMWAAESAKYQRDVAEFALAHKLPDAVEAAYQRSTLFSERKK